MKRLPAKSLVLTSLRNLGALLSLIVGVAGSSGHAQGSAAVPERVIVPSGTVFALRVEEHLPMRVGTHVRARLLYPIYTGSQLALPESTTVLGQVEALEPDQRRRENGRLRADFTPYHTAVVRFTAIEGADGQVISLIAGAASDGAPIFRIVPPAPSRGGFVRQQWDTAVAGVKDRLRVVTAPEKLDRLRQFAYHQLPYHPERIEQGTTWTVESTAPLVLPAAQEIAASTKPADREPASDGVPTWMVQAYLGATLSSETSKVGDAVEATVAEPIYNLDGTIAVPQGATLVGSVTKARPTRRLGRSGALSFSFGQLKLPDGNSTSVQTSLAGADAAQSADLAMNAEGEVKPKAQDKLLLPLLLYALAAGPLDRDGGQGEFGKDALASNSLGVLGLILGTAARQPNLAVGIGFYGTALVVYERVFARGKPVTFRRNTRIVLQTTARQSTPIKALSQSIK